MSKSKISMIGCGKLGLECAQVMANKHDVIGYDVCDVDPTNFNMVNTIEEATVNRDIIFIAVPTPHHPDYDGRKPITHLPPQNFDYGIVEDVLREINKYATKEQLVVLISTVLPGTTREHFIDLIPNARFIYNPYLIAMGSVAWDMVNPEMVIIGTETGDMTGDANELINFYETILENNPRYEVGTWDECEAIKIFYNTFISAKIGLVNMVQDVALRLGNMNVDVVTGALARSTQRITGPKYMTAGMGDGGACHPRDNIALRWLSNKLSLGYDLFGTIMESREIQAKNMADYLRQFDLPIVIVGKAYKPEVEYLDGSPSLLVASYIYDRECYYYDPILKEYPPENLGPAVYLLAHSAEITYVDAPHIVRTEYDIQPANDSIIVDPWRKQEYIPGCTVIHYGNTRDD